MALLDKVKVACRVCTTVYDDELTDLISAGLADLGVTDINSDLLVNDDSTITPLIRQALLTYCKKEFGEVELDTYNRLNEAYRDQKAQLLMSSTYGTYDEEDEE